MSAVKEKKLCRAYGLDEIALVPSDKTIDPELVDISVSIGSVTLDIPIIAAAMDSVASPKTAGILGKLGACAVLNLEGIHTRYDQPEKILEKIVSVNNKEYVALMQKLYLEHTIQPALIRKCIAAIKEQGVPVLVSLTPQRAEELGVIAEQAGADIILIQSTIISTCYIGKQDSKILDLAEFCGKMSIPVFLGNATTSNTTFSLMEAGARAVCIGVGPGAACTTRGVLGIGVPMATAIINAAVARENYLQQSGQYVPIIADGGIVAAGDICKAFACGADAVMIGSLFAKATESPGKGFHWGMATQHPHLPRGSRIYLGTNASLQEILIGPSKTDDGSQNLAGAIRTSLATLGAANLQEMQNIEIVIAPSNLTEGKVYQKAQQLGMYKE